MRRNVAARRVGHRPTPADRPTITVRFNDPAQHQLLTLVANEHHTSVNQLIQELIDAPLRDAAGELEGRLVRMVERLRSMTKVERARSIAAAARATGEAEGKYKDPFKARHVSREEVLRLRRALDEGRAEPDLG